MDLGLGFGWVLTCLKGLEMALNGFDLLEGSWRFGADFAWVWVGLQLQQRIQANLRETARTAENPSKPFQKPQGEQRI